MPKLTDDQIRDRIAGLNLEDVILESLEHRDPMSEPALCIGCGEPSDLLEPDAAFYPCDSCEERLVFSSWELLPYFAS